MRRTGFILLLALLSSAAAPADTIVLKNGRRIRATSVVEEGDRVSYETSAGRLSLPKSIVARIEQSSAGLTTGGEAGLAASPPRLPVAEGFEDVVRAAVTGDSVNREYLARLEQQADGGGHAALERLAVAHHAAAQHVLRSGELDQAIGFYRRTLTFAPGHVGTLLNIAYLHLHRSEYSAALDYLERARRVAPDSPDAAKLAGWAYYMSNRLDQAVEEWRRALKLRPDSEIGQALAKAERDRDVERSFREGETRHFTVRYDGSATPALAREILRTLEDHFRTIEAELNYTPPEPIAVILYTNAAFADITRAPAWVSAVNDGRLRLPVQGLTSVTSELSRVLRHELAHSFLAQKTHGRCPVWLHEGIAQWLEGMRARNAAAALIAAADRRGTLPLAALENSWLQLPGDVASFAYAWSLAVVEFIVESNGTRELERILDRIEPEGSAEAALRAILHADYAELEQQTIAYLRRTYLQ